MTRKNVSKENLLKEEVALSPPGVYLEAKRPHMFSMFSSPGPQSCPIQVTEGPNPHKESTCQCPTLSGEPRAPHTKGCHQ